MRVLIDACVWGGAAADLQAAGHEVERVADWSADPGDEQVLAHAAQHGQVLLTLDKDFGELAIVHRQPHCGIVRLVNLPARVQGHVGADVLQRYGDDLASGAIVTAEEGRVRIRPHDSE